MPKDETEDTNRQKRGKRGIVAWNQGEVDTKTGRKRVYVIASHNGVMVDEGQGGVEIRVGNPPAGMRHLKGTPQKTLSILGGPPPRKLSVKIGVVRATITNGTRITFGKDKSGLKFQKKIVRMSKDKLLASSGGNGRKRGRVV